MLSCRSNRFKKKLPIYFAANSLRTLRLTGQMADGWIPNPMNPELYRKRLRVIEASAREAGRTMNEIDTGIYLYTLLRIRQRMLMNNSRGLNL